MKILVTGSTGQLGFDVVKEGNQRGFEMVGVGSKDMDITNKHSVYSYVKEVNPDAIIHCAAYTAVDKAEDDKETCWNVNVEGTRNLVQISNELGIKFLYISTDYVFEGNGHEPFETNSPTNPTGYYGYTKLEGEKIVQTLLEKWFIVRISWVFGKNGNNFVKTMLRLSETRDEINVVADQYGSPTYTVDLSRLLIDMIQGESYGLYQASNEGYCSWADFAGEIFHQANVDVKVNPISTEEYPTRAVRPKNSRMSKKSLENHGFILLPSWQDALGRFLSEINHEVR